MKTIVTHFSPDVDAICSVWLVKKFMPGFSNAEITFVPAGETLYNKKPDSSKDIIHVDTGLGRFDHHQDNRDTCASKLVYEYLREKGYVKKSNLEALQRLVDQVNEIDHFRQVFWDEPASDRYELFLGSIVDGLRLLYPRESKKILAVGFEILEAIFRQFENKIWAENIIKNEGIKFKSFFGRTLAFESTNDEVVELAQKLGYKLVIRKDPRKGYLRIKALPIVKIDLTKIYRQLREKDKQATWYLHPSKHMILNGSTKNPEMRPTKLSLEEIIDIIKSI